MPVLDTRRQVYPPLKERTLGSLQTLGSRALQPNSASIGSAIAFIAQQPLPFEAGSLIVSDNGTLRRVPPRNSMRFRFERFGVPISAMAWRTPEGDGRVRIEGDLGPLPYSVEAPEARKRVLQVLYAARFLEEPLLVLSPKHTIMLCAETTVAEPVTPITVITAVASLVVDAHPYLELIGEYLADAARPA